MVFSANGLAKLRDKASGSLEKLAYSEIQCALITLPGAL